ncbi:MAG: hypothetical protein ACYC6A_09250 [Armatimonadota bacterium]
MPEPIRQQRCLFTDFRHIMCGDLEWRAKGGAAVPVAGPPSPPAPVTADPTWVADGIRLVAQPAQKTDPLPPGTPRGARVMHENGIYRSWSIKADYPPGQDLGSYSHKAAETVAIVYTESTDGFDWTEQARSPIIPRGVAGFDGFTVFVDPHGAASERYKAVYMASVPEDQHEAIRAQYRQRHPRYQDWRILERAVPYAIYAAVSPDGLHWESLPEPVMIHYSDTDTTVLWDEWLGKYVMYTRMYPFDRRVIARAETDDFRQWGPVSPLIWPGLEDPHVDIYLNAYSAYPNLPAYRFMFPMFYHRDNQRSDVRLFSSADGLVWNQVPGGPVIVPGESGAWDSEFIQAGKDIVPFGAGRVAVPYAGTPYPHKYPRWQHVLESHRGGWAWWPEGRLCALTAEKDGSFFTFRLQPAGRTLKLNLRTAAAGEVSVGLFETPGRSVAECSPLTGDDPAMTVHWGDQTDIGSPEGQPVILQFKLRHAELFGFEWA